MAIIALLVVSSAFFFFFCSVTREECILLSGMSAQREKSSHRRIEGKGGEGARIGFIPEHLHVMFVCL